jgi:hypothetical protein
VKTSSNVTWNLLAPQDAEPVCKLGYLDVDLCREYFERGDLCYTASLDGRLAHFSWVQRSGIHRLKEAGMSVPVAPGEFWIYFCMTADWARGQKLYPATLQRILREHFDSGYETGWIYTLRENVASQNGIAKAGFQKVTELSALRVGSHYVRMGPQLTESNFR